MLKVADWHTPEIATVFCRLKMGRWTVDSEPFLILAEEKNSDKVKSFREVDRNSFPLRQVLGTDFPPEPGISLISNLARDKEGHILHDV